ncbi:flagellar filament capping protein FliD [Poseidonibacter sp.]|uniref:flagellar filament capping protein FliD n=1 Tax=Poseidonibacter sp. TaxID=2321188 RepID=UPI003C74DA03
MATDYTQLGSFNTGAAASLNGELIQKLYDADSKSRVDPITKRLELIDTEKTKISEINTKVNELIAAIKPFDLFTTGNNAFEQVTATTTGESAIFDAADVGSLKQGTSNITISQLAQKDAYQSIKFTSKTDLISGGQDAGDKITINGTDFSTEGKNYTDLLSDINYSGTIDATIEQVSDTEFRLIIKSQEPGVSNGLTITQTGLDMGLENPTNHVLIAQNLNANVDGVDYDVSSNSITLDGNLKITASKIGDSSISIQKDDSAIIPAIQEMANKYNELLLMVTEELYSEDKSIEDTSSLRSIVSNIKNMMFEKYGTNDETLLNYGFSFDKTGTLEVDASILGKALTDNPDKVKDLFIGVAEDKGFGTLLKEHLDELNSFNGLFDTFESNRELRKTNLETSKEKAIKDLDTKYDTMAAQFSSYSSIISQMESSFSGLKQMIAAENSSN